MISKSIRRLCNLRNSSKYNFATSKVSGNLYMWGSASAVGYKVPTNQTKHLTPKRVEEFDGNVSKVCAGPNHTAVITNEGELYTFGAGNYGMLGHGDEKSIVAPKLVQFFTQNNLKVIDVALGENHSVALTDDGDVWTWGMGGKHHNFLVNLFFPSHGALGHGNNNEHKRVPTPVQALRSLPPTKAISSGQNFINIINAKNEVYSWGRGEYAAFGNGSNSNLKLPEQNALLQSWLEDNKIHIKQMKSSATYTLATFSDEKLYAWGYNEAGQLGITTEIGIELYETANFPTKVYDEKIKGKKIIDFDTAENVSVLLTDTNEVYWMGLRLAYEPQLLKLPANKKVVKVAAASKSIAVLMDSGEIFMKNTFLDKTSEDLDTGVLSANISGFNGGKVLDLGGSYRNRYAIVKN